jgi:hypothetical protein
MHQRVSHQLQFDLVAMTRVYDIHSKNVEVLSSLALCGAQYAFCVQLDLINVLACKLSDKNLIDCFTVQSSDLLV